jgi:putative ABC transport system permease protein
VLIQAVWLGGLLRRRTARVAAQVAGIGLAVMLTAALGMFFASSRSRMTHEAVAAVPVDWQVQLAPGADAGRALHTIRNTGGVQRAVEVRYADTPGFRSATHRTVQTTGPGQVLGLPREYASAFPGEIRYLVGARTGVLLAQQTAANLAVGIGSPVSVTRRGAPAVRLTVDGIVDLPAADSLFQSVGAPPGSAPTAPPDNVMVVPEQLWQRVFGPSAIHASRPTSGGGSFEQPAASGAPATWKTQIHVGLSSGIPPDPGAAFAEVVGRARNLEARLAGGALVGDNLAAQLDATRGDAVYAELLFLFLGFPGIVVAALVTAVVASSGRDRRRREQALLRVRGASPRLILRLAAGEAVLTGLLGVALGLAGAWLVGRVAFGVTSFGATRAQAIGWASVATILGLTLSIVTIVLPASRDVRLLTVRASQAFVGSQAIPRWRRLYVDIVCLLAGGLIYWRAVVSGYQVVLAPEGVPTITVDIFTLLAPLLLWIGGALFIYRIASVVLSRGRGAVGRLTRPIAQGLSGVVAASMSRQRGALSRGLAIAALATSFALSVAVFDSTFTVQARVDARLTNGADVTVSTTSTAGLPPGLPATVVRRPGVANAQPMQHRFAYVGNDLQDLYGIDPATVGQATSMSDAFFAGGSAQQALDALSRRPDGILVSDETVHDFQLHPGDLLRLRLQFASDQAYHVVPFHYIGIVREFPTAPRDSFLVANASYVAQRTGTPAFQTLLVRATGPPPSVAADIRRLLGPASGATVSDIVTQQRITLSGIPAIDLAGLTRLELAFALVLAIASSGLVLALGLAERRRTFAIASALGAKPRQLASFIWSEAAFVSVGGAILGGVGGWSLAWVIVRILTGVFDPPPDHLSIPWVYVSVVATAMVASIAVAAATMGRATRRPAVEILRDL